MLATASVYFVRTDGAVATNKKDVALSQSLSVVLPVCNVEDKLAQRVVELLDITADLARDVELLVVDDGSKDNVTIETVSSSIVLPIEAIVYNAGVPYVFVVDRGVANKQRLEVVAQAGTRVAVRGLAAGDTVIAAGNRFLTDGMTFSTRIS